MLINRDDMNHASVQSVANASVSVIDRLQDYPAAVQVPAITAAFRLLIERLDLDPADAFTVADNIMNHADGRRTEFQAVAAYLANEV